MGAGKEGVLVSEKNMYRTACDIVRASNLDDPQAYFTDPDSDEAKQARDIKAQAEQQMTQKNDQLVQMANSIETQKNETAMLKAQLDANAKSDDMMFKYQRLFEEMTEKYTELELQHRVDIPGEGVPGTPMPDPEPAPTNGGAAA